MAMRALGFEPKKEEIKKVRLGWERLGWAGQAPARGRASEGRPRGGQGPASVPPLCASAGLHPQVKCTSAAHPCPRPALPCR